MLPSKDQIRVCFAHVAYQMKSRFDAGDAGIASFEVRSKQELAERIGEADVLSVSGFWDNGLIPQAKRLRFIQSISAGTDQYDRAALEAAGIRLASAAGVNARAVAEHAMALILALARRLPEARDNQARRFWRGMISDLSRREDELGGKTLLIVGLGRIGGRLAQLAKAFDMRVLATRNRPEQGAGGADRVGGPDELRRMAAEADYVALTCPLTPATTGLISAEVLAAMRRGAGLVNVSRGRVIDEPALIAALREGRVAAALDCTVEEPLPADSPLWAMPNVLLTPHTAGETRHYEDNVIDLLLENLDRLWRGETELRNQVV